MLDEDFHYNVLELDVHYGGHSFLLRPQQSGSEHHAQVGYCHQVLLVVAGHTVEKKEKKTATLVAMFERSVVCIVMRHNPFAFKFTLK